MFYNFVSARQLAENGVLDHLLELASKFEELDEKGKLPETLKGKVMASVFYEPSTRTRFSFESAMHKLGGRVITSEAAALFSSAKKGETLSDAMKVISSYADVIVLRHEETGAARTALEAASVPVINAGDGVGEHPTQALLDAYTIKKELGGLESLKIAIVGDLLNGRTVHSLAYMLPLLSGAELFLVSPPSLRLPEPYKQYLQEKNTPYHELDSLDGVLGEADVVYMTRVQKERFKSLDEYEKVKNSYVLTKESLAKMKEKSVIMHPLPRVNEILPEVDSDKRAAYFRQAKNGVYARMALLHTMLGKAKHGIF